MDFRFSFFLYLFVSKTKNEKKENDIFSVFFSEARIKLNVISTILVKFEDFDVFLTYINRHR